MIFALILASFLSVSEPWHLAFSDGTALAPAACSAVTNADSSVTYSSPLADVVLAPSRRSVRVTAKTKTVRSVRVPGEVRFSPDAVERVTFPGDRQMGAGYSLKPDFFRRSREPRLALWRRVPAPINTIRRLYGATYPFRPIGDEVVEGQIAPAETNFFTASERKAVSAARFEVNRAPLRDQCSRIVVDSKNGPLLSARKVGAGEIWRIGSASHADGEKARFALIRGAVRDILARRSGTRRKVGYFAFAFGPKNAFFCPVLPEALADYLRTAAGSDCVAIESPEQIAEAERSGEFALLVNPYVETLPVARIEEFRAAAQSLQDYLTAGGAWLELGGASFHSALVPEDYFSIAGDYPGLFADFVHFRFTQGRFAALFGVREDGRFVPGRLEIGGDAQGGYLRHSFDAWVKPGQTWATPETRCVEGLDLSAACDAYVKANGLTRTLAEKARRPAMLETLKAAPLLYLGENLVECEKALPHIPVPSLIHQAQYLHGGFDKQYPDHLPVHPSFGTDAAYRAFIDRLHALGHLYSPYTNPTWWCDDPPGPTFVAAGKDPLVKDEKGNPLHEQYGRNGGWTICFWHPAVIAANRKTVRQFTEDFPSDILFQDQCGARLRRYDFSVASPSPIAYTEGLLRMVKEDSRKVPLGTEDGWDRVANEEVLLCGMSWRMIPLAEKEYGHNLLEKGRLPPHLWDFEALSQRMFHDKCLFMMHDLGAFVYDERTLAWCVAFGYHLSYRVSARAFTEGKAGEKKRRWYAHLHDVQKNALAKIDGRRLVSFSHDRSPFLARTDLPPTSRLDDGIVRAEYEGGLKVFVNLGDLPRTVDGHALAPYAFRITE